MRTNETSEEEAGGGSGQEPPATEDVSRLMGLLTELGRRRSLRDPIAASCEDLQLTAPQIHAVGWLGRDRMLTMGELARRLCISEKTATGVVDRLVSAGRVQRERDPSDRRLVCVSLTEAGVALSHEIDKHVREMLDRVLSFLDTPRRDALFDILETLLDRMGREAAGPASPADDS